MAAQVLQQALFFNAEGTVLGHRDLLGRAMRMLHCVLHGKEQCALLLDASHEQLEIFECGLAF
jgi:hypothetical protein